MVPRMLNSRLTAKASSVNRALISMTRTGIVIQRGGSESGRAMSLSYTKRDCPSSTAAEAVRYNEVHVERGFGNHSQPGGHRSDRPCVSGSERDLLRALGRDHDIGI